MNNDNKENISLKGKTGEEILDIYNDISKDTLLLFEYLEKYDNKEEAFKEYQKVKMQGKNNQIESQNKRY